MDEKYRKAGLALLLITFAAILFYTVSQSNTGQERAVFLDETGEVKAEITFETASTPEEKRTGLMNRTSLEESHGMIFVYEDEELRTFWMKNTLIPLDIIFLDSNKQIINIKKAYPEPNTPDSELERYRSDAPAQYVIEVNQNFTDRHGIEPGDQVEFSAD
ncbi:MAG: uncharacterized membrane protein (UPF0127 family) [Candidatus Nanohaloarchaea archaeon]|jgi:uncharacterized membrane protein (UPF0127 family)